MIVNIMLHQGPADGEMRTLYHAEPPLDLRVAVNPPPDVETPTVAVYRVMRVEEAPLEMLGATASYVYQGTRPSAWSLVDFTVAK